jgi:hypothetical protein
MANTICPPQIIQLPPALTQVQVLMDEFDITPIDATNVGTTFLSWDDAGISTGGGSTGYDLTSGIDRAAFATDIANQINNAFGTSTTSTSCTLSGSLLSVNVICSGTIANPMPSVSLAVFDNPFSASFSLPVYYS